VSAGILVFDVNETLLDVKALRPQFERVVGDGDLLGPWFGLMLRNSLVATATETYQPFDVQGTDALVITARKAGIGLSWDDAASVVAGMAELPPHPDVEPALARLLNAGYDLVTLTNSSPSMVQAQVQNAGLSEYFSRKFSVEAAGVFKPDPRPYQLVMDGLGVPANELWMIAAHDWDITGAMRAGMRGAFVARPGQMVSTIGETADLTGVDLGDVADQLIGS
jgi:2-haloacid dehalogenase